MEQRQPSSEERMDVGKPGPMVTVENLTKRFGDFLAVDDVSLTVSKGEIFGFLGANGAGKTTTIRMLCGLLLPSSGKGTVGGFDIYRESEKIKRTIGYMSQKFSLYRDLTGRENLQFYGSVYGLRSAGLGERIDEVAAMLELAPFIDRLAGSVPVGWRQRLALAAALLHRPQMLFLDEPTAGVDLVFRRRFWDILYDLADRGTTLFVTTHYMDEAEFCRRVSIMDRGRIVEIGSPLELKRKHGQPGLQEVFLHLVSGGRGQPSGGVKASGADAGGGRVE
jgi:ABC-2 type transport system ATP-binding protein